MVSRPTQNKRVWLRWLLILPAIALSYPSFYNRNQPTLVGIPFFYWYQTLWIFLTSLLLAGLYRLKA
ncbi:hypothetical protein SAMD00079811_05470 [Scytonema sp. HK-05]|uniref:DUF3311 domain-containing protein n=1 Tax=Scytonema sp. HK-05 TaxID=1137095 RepID=UPI0009360170|nr:DUF3311 domain-containing protein [Scytonema sp. HK-05]OKH60084.1 hypothetical protein NIES2130_04795 [Scytonema sp. HK-05]BAY42969.1 hypothetical protein SAMD00079811_05470 [Scytonema sp. HK-05]